MREVTDADLTPEYQRVAFVRDVIEVASGAKAMDDAWEWFREEYERRGLPPLDTQEEYLVKMFAIGVLFRYDKALMHAAVDLATRP